jgi:predicted transcriptional regulator
MNEFNKVFLASHPEIARSIARRLRQPKVIVVALKPKYAKAIYEGRKNWEFRKAPPPLFRWLYVYESAPISAVTGRVIFSESVTGIPLAVMDIVKTNKCYTKNLAGISLSDLKEYAGERLVTALRIYKAERFDKPIPFDAKPPQNWGRYAYRTVPKQTAQTEGGVQGSEAQT